MRIAIFGVLAFVLGLGGTTGVMVFTTPVRLTAADSLAIARSDTSHAARRVPAPAPQPAAAAPVTAAPPAAPHESTAVGPQPLVATAASSAIVTASTGTAPAPLVQHVVPPATAAARPVQTAVLPDAETYKQVGSILLNMKPAEAAKIVGYLNDDQVEGLLRSMSPRQAAGMLAQITPERAAALSRRLLIPRETRP